MGSLFFFFEQVKYEDFHGMVIREEIERCFSAALGLKECLSFWIRIVHVRDQSKLGINNAGMDVLACSSRGDGCGCFPWYGEGCGF